MKKIKLLSLMKESKEVLKWILMLGIIFFVGYIFGMSSAIGMCAKVASRTLQELGISQEDLNNLIQRYINLGRTSG